MMQHILGRSVSRNATYTAGCGLLVALSGCQPCFGKTGDELKQCEAKEAAEQAKADSDTPDSCKDWRVLTSVHESGTLGSGSMKCFNFELEKPGTVSFETETTDGDAQVNLIQNNNKNSEFEDSEVFVPNHPATSGTLTSALERGSYTLRLDRGNASYKIAASYLAGEGDYPGEDASNELGSAMPLDLSANGPLSGYVGVVDATDLYEFELEEPATVSFTAKTRESDAQLNLLQDGWSGPANGTIEDAEVFVANHPASSGTLKESLEKGTYYLRLDRGNTTYSLGASLEAVAVPGPAEDPGESLSSALELDLSSSVTLGGYVGMVDPTDFYRFEIAVPGTVSFTVEVRESDLQMNLIQDGMSAKANGTVEDTEVFVANHPASSGTLTSELKPGSYYLRIDRGNTTYRLSTQFTPT